ncbi:MAG TPA: response regulator, partial [Desulfobacteria bacterium]|nr:response regulator [Desulfobacteria bacterium]
ELYRKNSYHLILMDVQMPVMDGYEATRQIRKLEKQNRQLKPAHKETAPQPSRGEQKQSEIQRIPIVAMTAHAVEGYREECLKAGMDDYLTKPLKRKHFLAVVEKWARLGKCGDVATSRVSPDLFPDTIIPEERDFPQHSGNHESHFVGHPSMRGFPMDFERALTEFEGDRDFLTEVLKGFTHNVRGQIGLLQKALVSRDADRVRREAHSIKGGAANLRANSLSSIALELENIGKSGELAMGGKLLKRLEKELEALEDMEKTLQAA